MLKKQTKVLNFSSKAELKIGLEQMFLPGLNLISGRNRDLYLELFNDKTVFFFKHIDDFLNNVQTILDSITIAESCNKSIFVGEGIEHELFPYRHFHSKQISYELTVRLNKFAKIFTVADILGAKNLKIVTLVYNMETLFKALTSKLNRLKSISKEDYYYTDGNDNDTFKLTEKGVVSYYKIIDTKLHLFRVEKKELFHVIPIQTAFFDSEWQML